MKNFFLFILIGTASVMWFANQNYTNNLVNELEQDFTALEESFDNLPQTFGK